MWNDPDPGKVRTLKTKYVFGSKIFYIYVFMSEHERISLKRYY